jgi:hypothetical protein
LRLTIPCDDDLTRDLWNGLIEVAAVVPADWTLIGGQMVHLHGLEHDRTPPRRSTDLDVIVNVRALTGQPQAFVDGLSTLGYEIVAISPDNLGHRFVRGRVKIDVLLPDGIGERAPREVLDGVSSIEVPGGTQALNRTVAVDVRTDTRIGTIQRPTLLGAILIKARAVDVDDLPAAQREDLAFLLSLVRDPFEMAGELRGRERTWLRRRTELLDADARAWRAIDGGEDGHSALKILAEAYE